MGNGNSETLERQGWLNDIPSVALAEETLLWQHHCTNTTRINCKTHMLSFCVYSCVLHPSHTLIKSQASSSSSLPLSQPSSYSSQILTRPSQSASRSSIPTSCLATRSIDRTFCATEDEVDREVWTASVLDLVPKSNRSGKLFSRGKSKAL